MPEETNPMEPLVEIETEVAGEMKLRELTPTPTVEEKMVGSMRKIGECIVSVANSS